MTTFKPFAISIAMQIAIAISSAHATYFGQRIEDDNSQPMSYKLSMWFGLMFVYSIIIALGLYSIKSRRIYYANIILYPLIATMGVSIAAANKWISSGFDDLRWFFTVLILFVFAMVITGAIKLTTYMLNRFHDKRLNGNDV
jgi:hypothetical protein